MKLLNRSEYNLSVGQTGDNFALMKTFFSVKPQIGWLCLTSHRQRGYLETAPPFTVPCEGREARFLHRTHQESNPGLSCGSPLHNRCTMQPEITNGNL